METLDHEPKHIHNRAPAVIKLGTSLISASDYGNEETRKLLEMKGLKEDAINQIMASRLIAELEQRRETGILEGGGECYPNHTSGVTLLLLLELFDTDPDILAAAESHNILSKPVFGEREMKNLINRAASHESLRITQVVTKLEEMGDVIRDEANKEIYFNLIKGDKKATKLKVANRMYNLRCLDIFHIAESILTDEHLEKAKEYIQETRRFMLPIATDHNLKTHLLDEIEAAEKRYSEVSLILTQRKAREAIEVKLMP